MNTMLRRRGYTMIEMLLVVAVIGLLVMLLVASIGQLSRNARVARVETEVLAIEQALRSYAQLYGRFPRHPDLGSDMVDPEGTAGASAGLSVNQHLVRLLRGENHPTSRAGTGGRTFPDQNPRKVVFMELSDTSLDSDGDFVDAWGNAYRYMCDFNYDNTVSVRRYYGNNNPLVLEGQTVAVWSRGPTGDRPASPTAVDTSIRSWE